jgi:hypothetical protein
MGMEKQNRQKVGNKKGDKAASPSSPLMGVGPKIGIKKDLKQNRHQNFSSIFCSL